MGKKVDGEFYAREDAMYMRVDPSPIPVRSGLSVSDEYTIHQLRNARVCGRYLNHAAPWSGLVDAAYIGTFKRVKIGDVPKHIYKILMEVR